MVCLARSSPCDECWWWCDEGGPLEPSRGRVRGAGVGGGRAPPPPRDRRVAGRGVPAIRRTAARQDILLGKGERAFS